MKSTKILTAVLLGTLLMTPALAAEDNVLWNESLSLSETELTADNTLRGVVFTEVPDSTMGRLCLGARTITTGDVLTAEQLNAVTFIPTGAREGDAVISCLQFTESDKLTDVQTTIKVKSEKSQPPTAEDSQFTTYKNIPAEIPLSAADPDGDPLTVNIVKEPKRGSVAVSENGTVTYTPDENKVGHDSFVYTVTDPAGNVSGEATVRIRIEKPSAKETYGDMEGHPAQLAAAWLREEGIYQGGNVGGQPLFHPEESVTRGDFIAMCVCLTGQNEGEISLSTGFADESDTPTWLSPYVSTALRCGYITGVPTEQGLALNADAPITEGEAAKIVSSLLALPETTVVSSLEDEHWAQGAIAAMAEADIYHVSDADAPLTRGNAAMLLYEVHLTAAKEENSTLLAWAQE